MTTEKEFYIFIKNEKDKQNNKQPRQVFYAEKNTPLIICKQQSTF